MQLPELLGYISQAKIGGIVPLDAVSHILGGGILTVVGLLFKLKMRNIFLIIALPTLIKEYFDLQVLNYPLYEPIKDILLTYLVFIGFLFRKIWRRSKDS